MQNKKTISQDFKDLFQGKKSGHLTEYVYSGEDFFEQLVTNNKDYYPYYSEINLIKDNANEISKILGPNRNIVEVGPGSKKAIRNKILPILKTLKNPASYTAIDTHLPYAQEAADYVNKEVNLKTYAIKNSYFNSEIFNHPKNLCLLLLGCTICNIDDESIKRFLSKVSKSIEKNDYFIFSVDSNTDPDYIKKAYDNIWLEQLAFNTFRFFKKEFDITNFDPSLFQYKYNWDPKLAEVQIILIAKTAQKFTFENEEIFIKPGTEYHIITSKKRPELFFKKVLGETNFILEKVLKNNHDKYNIYIVKAT